MENFNQYHKCLTKNVQNSNEMNKVDQVFCLSSLYNSRNLELNSQIILNLTQSTESLNTLTNESCESLRKVLIGIIYEEWFELFEYNQNLNFNDQNHLVEILKRRLNSRHFAKQALQNIIRFKFDQKTELINKEISLISEFGESLILNYSFSNSADVNNLNSVKATILKISNETSIIYDLGFHFTLIEMIEMLWNFKLIKSIEVIEITRLSLKIINNILKNYPKLTFSRRWFLVALKNCLNHVELVSSVTFLFNNFSKSEPQSLIKLDLTHSYCSILVNKIECLDYLTLKLVLIMLNNLSLVYPNKAKISQGLSVETYRYLFNKNDDKILELILGLIKSISNEFGKEKSLELFKFLADNFLKYPNISLVSITCEILWLLSSKLDKNGHEELISLDIDSKLKSLTNSTNSLIASSCFAILKNMYSTNEFLVIRNSMDDLISSPSRLSMTSSINSTSSSSSSSIMLPSRHKKQFLENENELIKKLNLSSDSSESIFSTGSSSSNDTYYLNDSDKSVDDIVQKEIEIQFEEIKCKSIIKSEHIQKQNTKHVTFNMEFNDEIYIEIDASSTDSIKKQQELIDLNFKPESLVYLNFLNRSRRYQEKVDNKRLTIDSRSISPVRDPKFIKSKTESSENKEKNNFSISSFLEPVKQESECRNNEKKIFKNIQANTNKLVGLVRPLKA